MKVKARIITRMQSDTDGLFLGAVMDKTVFEPNTIYEIVEIMDVLVIRKVGVSAVADTKVTESPLLLSWALEVGQVLAQGGKRIFLTKEENDLISGNN